MCFFNGKELKTPPEGVYGFVYKITDNSGGVYFNYTN